MDRVEVMNQSQQVLEQNLSLLVGEVVDFLKVVAIGVLGET